MASALLFYWNPRGIREQEDEIFDRVVAGFPSRVRCSSHLRKVSARYRLSVWSHEASLGDGYAHDPSSNSWLVLLGNPSRVGLAQIDESQVAPRMLNECLRYGPDALRTLSPPFGAIFHHGGRDDNHVVVDRAGLQHLYLREESEGRAWISSASFALAQLSPSSLDPQAVGEWLSVGHFITNRTFVRQVRKLGCGEQLRLSDGTASLGVWAPDEIGEHLGAEGEESFRARFLAALRAVGTGDGMATELTGGLDSRLTLAGVLSEKLPAFAWTYGQAESDELQTIRRLRRRVTFPHLEIHVDPGLGGRLPELFEEMHELCDGEVNAFVYAPLLDAFAELAGRRRVSISGGGGEIARGFYYGVLRGYGPRVRGIPMDGPRGMVAKVTATAGPLRRMLRRDVFPAPELPVRSAIQGFLEGSRAACPAALLDDFYLRARMQRFAGRNVSTTGLFGRQSLPYFSDDLIDLSFALPPKMKRGGWVIRRSVERLSPELAAVPLQNGIPVPPASWRRPDRLARRLPAFSRKVAGRLGSRHLAGVLRTSPGAIPWEAVTTHDAVIEMATELLVGPDSRIAEFVEPAGVREVIRTGLGDGSVYPLGLLMTLELTLRRLRG